MSLEHGITRALVRTVRTLRWRELPAEVREVARHCLLDFLGVALAGAREPLTEILIDVVVRREGSSEAGILGRPERASRLSAALVNGAGAHALESTLEEEPHRSVASMVERPEIAKLHKVTAIIADGMRRGVSFVLKVVDVALDEFVHGGKLSVVSCQLSGEVISFQPSAISNHSSFADC